MYREYPARGVRDRVLTLRSFEALRELDFEALSLLAEHARYRHFGAGERVQSRNDPLREIHMVVEGRLEVVRLEHQVAVPTRGEPAGMLSVMARDPTGLDITALEESRTLAIPREVIIATLEENFSIMRHLLRLSARGLLAQRRRRPAHESIEEASAPRPVPSGEKTLTQHVLEMRKNPLFSGTNIDAVIEMARHLRPLDLAEGHVLWELDEPSTFALRIGSGYVKCTTKDGETVVVGEGFQLGVLDGLADLPRGFAAETLTPVVAYRSELEMFLAVLESHPTMAADLLSFIAIALLLRGEKPEDSGEAPSERRAPDTEAPERQTADVAPQSSDRSGR